MSTAPVCREAVAVALMQEVIAAHPVLASDAQAMENVFVMCAEAVDRMADYAQHNATANGLPPFSEHDLALLMQVMLPRAYAASAHGADGTPALH